MRPQVDYRQARADAVAQQSQTRTWSGVVIDSMAVNGTCKVRMSGGATQVCTLPPNTTVDYGQVVLVCRYPGTTRPVIMSAGNNGLTDSSQIVSAQVTASLTVHELSGALHTGVLADAQVPVTIPRLAAANDWSATQAFRANASFGVHGTTDAQLKLCSGTTYRPGDFWINVGLGAVGANEDPIMAIGYNAPVVSAIPVIAEASIWTGYEGHWYVDPTNQYLEWYVRWRTANDVYAGGAFQTSIDIDTGYVYTTIWGDAFRFANGADTVNYFQIIGGGAAFTVPIGITGVSDAIQFQVRGYSTQTNPIFAVQDSVGNNYFNIGTNGIITINSTAHVTDQIWAMTHAVSGGAQPYIYGQNFSAIRDNSGPAWSWTFGFTSTAAIRALTADAYSRYAYAGSFNLEVDANSGKTATIGVSAHIIEARLTKSGTGTTLVASPHGLHVYDMGGTGSYAGVGVYIESQTAGTTQGYSIYTNAGLVHFGDGVSVPSLDVYYTAGSVYSRLTTDSSGNLIIDPTGGLIKPGTGDALQSQTYTSDLQGWKINASGDAEFNNITARGALRVAVLQYGYVLATGGSVWITRAAGRLLVDCTTADDPSSFNVDIEDPDGMTHATAGALWRGDDLIRLKEPLTGDCWAVIDSITDMTTYWRLVCLKASPGPGTNYTFRAGLAVLNYGAIGDALIQISADATHAPYMQMATLNAYDDFTLLTRIGNLNGCFDYATDVYGFVAGNYAASNTSIAVDATNGIRIFNGTTKVGQWDVSGNISVGNAGSEHVYITSTSVQIKDNTSIYTDLTAGTLTLGLVSGGEYVSIDGTNGLRLYGNAVLLGQWTAAGGIVIGEVANSKSRIEIASGAISLISRSAGGADTTKISLAADGSAAFTGSVTAASGTIGGWTIGATALTASLVEGIMVGLDSGGTNPAFYAGSTIPGSAPFRVTMAGALTATDATITGTIDANAGHIGALDIDGILTIAAAGEIRQGTGTLGSNFTGLRVWNDTSVGRIGGYAADVLQWYAGTDGKLYAGAGLITIDVSGITIAGANSQSGAAIITWTNVLGTAFAFDTCTDTGIDGAVYRGIEARHDLLASRNIVATYIGVRGSSTSTFTGFFAQKGDGASITPGLAVVRLDPMSDARFVIVDASALTNEYLSVDNISIHTPLLTLIGDTTNALMSVGLTINQGTYDDEILAFKSGDVAHGITDYAETDTFTAYSKYSATDGGLRLRCFSEDIVGMQVSGMVTNGDTTRSTAAVGAIVLNAAKKTGTAVTVMGANENLLVVSDANSARMIVDAEGDLHLDATSNINVWDAYDDVALLMAYRSISAQKVFGDWVEEHALLLEETGIITRNPDGHHFVSVKGLTALIIDAIRQLSLKVEQHENQLTECRQGGNLDRQIPFRR